MIILVNTKLFSENVFSWIQEILNRLVSVLGLLFVIINAKESENVRENK